MTRTLALLFCLAAAPASAGWWTTTQHGNGMPPMQVALDARKNVIFGFGCVSGSNRLSMVVQPTGAAGPRPTKGATVSFNFDGNDSVSMAMNYIDQNLGSANGMVDVIFDKFEQARKVVLTVRLEDGTIISEVLDGGESFKYATSDFGKCRRSGKST